MKRTSIFIGTAVAAALAAAVGYGSFAAAQPYGGPGMMGGYGPGMMGGHGPGRMGGYGPGYGPDEHCPFYGRGMTSGYGPGWMHGNGSGRGPGWSGQQSNLNLSIDDVKSQLERWIARQDNPRLKVGEVKEKDADTITGDIVTKDNSLVQRFIVDRRTGVYRRDES